MTPRSQRLRLLYEAVDVSLLAGYTKWKTRNISEMTTKQATLASGPTLPPVSQRGPWNEELSKCPGAAKPLSGTP